MSGEIVVLDLIQAYFQNPVMDAVMPVITGLGNQGIVWIILSAVLLLFPKTRKMGMAVAVGLVLEAVCCNVILKPLVGRIRPCQVNTAVTLLIAQPMDFSFPSGHTGASFAAVSVLWLSKSRLRIPALMLAALIGFSRLYLYVHYPSDVLAGAVLGMFTGWLGSRLVQWAGEKYSKHSQIL